MIKIRTHYESAPSRQTDTPPSHLPNDGTPRAMSVALKPETLAKLEELARRSGMRRHRYAISILEQAAAKDIVLRQQLEMSDGLVGSVTSELK